jgi:1-deoxy-D-xylulose-5-phosphate reductoisomerase
MTEVQKQRVCILGSTGSVGTSTLDVIARHPKRFEVFALTAHSRVDELLQQCMRWRPRFAVLPDAAQARVLRQRLAVEGGHTEVLEGPQALCEMAIVVGGALFMESVREGGAALLPIDSEHSAIFQCLPEDRAAWPQRIDHILLTSSGGPFRRRDPATLRDVTPDMACAHPNFVMGRKISVDSATMMNKALEVIEARWLFDLQPEQVQVLIHPQQIVHSMVVCRDNSVLAQLGTPDMRVPIAYGLSFPERIESGAARLDFHTLAGLSFEPADLTRYPGLGLSWEALRAPSGSTAVLNAANEEAVAAFLAGTIRFDQIHSVNAGTIEVVRPEAGDSASLDGLLALDERARHHARQTVKGLAP